VRIEQSLVSLSSHRAATVSDMTHSTMEAWIGDRPSRAAPAGGSGAAATSAGSSAADAQRAAIARLSAEALAMARQTTTPGSSAGAIGAASTSDATGPDGMSDPAVSDPKLAVLILLVERMTGHKIQLVRPGDVPANAEEPAQQAGPGAVAAVSAAKGAPAAPQRAGWGVEIQVQQVHQESESTSFTATGQVVTADGRTINFDYQLQMSRSFSQTTTTDLQAGDAVKKIDPIALNLSGGPVALRQDRSAFDINSDGTAEQVALPAAGTYFVAIDANGNGKIDNGSELFGPATGNGFTELKALDTNHNGWVDSGDAAYASLKLWSGADGGLSSLDQAGVGALYVGKSVSTQFDLRSAANETLGQLISSSVYLGENGQPGQLAQVDLTA
jgi:hypothetical protein